MPVYSTWFCCTKNVSALKEKNCLFYLVEKTRRMGITPEQRNYNCSISGCQSVPHLQFAIQSAGFFLFTSLLQDFFFSVTLPCMICLLFLLCSLSPHYVSNGPSLNRTDCHNAFLMG